MLKQRNIKATFFLIGQNVAANPNIVKQILADGNEVGNHTWTHPQLSKLSDDKVTAEITKTQDAIKDASGYTPTLLRPPFARAGGLMSYGGTDISRVRRICGPYTQGR